VYPGAVPAALATVLGAGSPRCWRAVPDASSHLGNRLGDFGPELRGELVECPVHRRVRRYVAEEIFLTAQMLDVGTALHAPGNHESGLHDHFAAIVQRRTPRAGAKTRREAISEPATKRTHRK
jgi:hypothetical protein